MKRFIYKLSFIFLFIFSIPACDDILDVEVYSELSPEVSSEAVIRSILYNAYANALLPFWEGGIFRYWGAEMPTGIAWNEDGGVATRFNQLRFFTWASNHFDLTQAWITAYAGIRDANILLDNVDEETPFGREVISEAKFIRGYLYYLLYDWFGEVPLRTSALDLPYIGKASKEQIWGQIEKDLLEAAELLPLEPLQTGRASRGAAYGILCKHYLNTLQWQKSADMAKLIIDMGKYGLVPEYKEVFTVDNKGNQEMLWVLSRTTSGVSGHSGGAEYVNALSFPPDYPLLSNQATYAAKVYYYDAFLDSFEDGDDRADLFLRDYINRNDDHIQLYGNDKSISLKFEYHPTDVGPAGSTDQPEVRYADILLSRAEALNELQGPTQESVDLINQIRERAGIQLYALTDFEAKEVLRAAVLQEREWEFWSEAKLRQDYIRHDVFLSRALARGVYAQPHHIRYPIPLSEVNANPELEQTEGY